MEFVTVKIHRNTLPELRKLKAQLMQTGQKVSDADTVTTAIDIALQNKELMYQTRHDDVKFEEALRKCQEAFADLTEKDWKEFKKAARIKWKPRALSF